MWIRISKYMQEVLNLVRPYEHAACERADTGTKFSTAGTRVPVNILSGPGNTLTY